MWAAAREGKGGVYNIGSPEETRIKDLLEVVFEVTGHRPKIDLRPAPVGSVARRVPDIAKIGALGFRPRTALFDGVRACWRK